VCVCVSRAGPDKLVTTRDRPRQRRKTKNSFSKIPSEAIRKELNLPHEMTDKVKSAYESISITKIATIVQCS
jgi:hypothetical protein